MNKIRKILVILLILIMWGGIKAENAVYAKASEAKEENFANIVLFAHFAGENSEQDKKYFEENRNEIIKLYDDTWKISNKLFKHNILWKISLEKHISTR